jgi:hypothetical protein
MRVIPKTGGVIPTEEGSDRFIQDRYDFAILDSASPIITRK